MELDESVRGYESKTKKLNRVLRDGWTKSEEAHDNVNHLLLHTACFDAHPPPHAHSSTLMLRRRVYFKLHSAPHNIFLPAISLPLGTKVQPTVWNPPILHS